MPSMFKNAQNIHITGGSFNINVNRLKGPSLDVLHKRVAPNAILNAGGRADEVRCYPGTREEVIGRIEKWRNAQDGLIAPIFWLSGPAGAGKSAIVQTIAERCGQSGEPHANFFFFRADSSRSNAYPLIATLLHQIVLIYPPLYKSMATLLATNPLILDSTLENQLIQLIVIPLRAIQLLAPAYRPLILLIDGLDECDSESKRSQQQILGVFDQILAEHPTLFRLLVASRNESQIQMAFNGISSQYLHLYLDNKYSPENDIRVFVNAQFEQVRKTHPLAHTLDENWPLVKDVDYIVEKSSGQFIYAATVMRFIMDSSASPTLSFDRVQGAARLATKSPFSHLDALYTYILSQAEDQEVLTDILHAQFLLSESSQYTISLITILELYNQSYTQTMVVSCLADLTPIANYSYNTLRFHHASFRDYLLDQSRSGNYAVDIPAFSYQILPVVWNLFDRGLDDKSWIRFGLAGLRRLQKLPPGFMNTLASSKHFWGHVQPGDSYDIRKIHELCTSEDDVLKFRRILRLWLKDFEVVRDSYNLGISYVPFGCRYFQMARGDYFWNVAPDREMTAALSPESDFDRHELGLWLNDILHRIHREIYPRNFQRYTQLLNQWISWAVKNDIPCHGFEDLPDAQQHIQRSMPQNSAVLKHEPRGTRK